MIPIPNPPTDNLYKFLFVFGIILSIAVMFILPYKLNNSKASELQSIENKLRDSLKKHKAYYMKDSLEIISGANFSKNKRILTADSIRLMADLKSGCSAQISKDRVKEIGQDWFMKALAYIFVTGGVIAVFGAFKWYTTTQKYNDLILQLQYEKMKKEQGDTNQSGKQKWLGLQKRPR